MTLIDILRPWIAERWPLMALRRNSVDHHIVSISSGWVAKIFDNHVEVRDTSDIEHVCICCSNRLVLKAGDPEFFPQLETALNAIMK